MGEQQAGESQPVIHYVSTRDFAKQLIENHDKFWVSDCGCRESRDGCKRSRIDVCLQFREGTAATDTGLKEISRSQADEIVREAEEKHLVSRPFRNENDMGETDGVCFCCDDCCGFFVDPGGYTCDKGKMIEATDPEQCTDCGLCVDVCYFDTRKLDDGKLAVNRENCYGCGLCLDVCPEDCIELVSRTQGS